MIATWEYDYDNYIENSLADEGNHVKLQAKIDIDMQYQFSG